MKSTEFSSWIAFDDIEPGYPVREDLHNARVVQMTHNVHASKQRDQLSLKDCILTFQETVVRQPWQVIMQKMSWIKKVHDSKKEKKK